MAVVTEKREVRDFNQIALQGVGQILLVQGDQESLTIEAEQDLLPKIKSEVEGGKLVLGWKSWLDNILSFGNQKIIFHVGMKRVNGVSISGAGSLGAQQIQTDRCEFKVSGSGELAVEQLTAQGLDLHISGTGHATLAGKADTVNIHVSGAGHVQAASLSTKEADVQISGSGDVELAVSTKLNVGISGSGDVKYVGQPNVTQRISGIGRVDPLNAKR